MAENHSTFRFANDQLQSSLIKAIKAVGIEFTVTEDGSVRYSNVSIEWAIDEIVEAVFGNSYYRVEIGDPIKTYRYRRFKKFRGTPFIEEIRDGSTFFVQKLFEKLFRHRGIPTHVSYVLSDKDLDPDKTTAHLGIRPTFACRKGEPFTRPYTFRRKDVNPPASYTGWWELCSIPHIESNEVIDHLNWLFDILDPIELKLNSLAQVFSNKDYRVLQISSVLPRGSMQGLSLSSSQLGRLSILCDRVDTWYLPDDYI